MNELQITRWDRLLRKLGAITAGSVSPILSPEVMPVIQVEAPDIEHRYPGEWVTYEGYWFLGGVALQYPRIGIRNGTTETLVVVERVLLSDPSASFWGRMRMMAYPGGYTDVAVTNSAEVDGRQGTPLSTGAKLCWRQDAAAVDVGGTTITSPASVITQSLGPYVLSPGRLLVATNINVAANLVASFRWRERSLHRGEL